MCSHLQIRPRTVQVALERAHQHDQARQNRCAAVVVPEYENRARPNGRRCFCRKVCAIELLEHVWLIEPLGRRESAFPQAPRGRDCRASSELWTAGTHVCACNLSRQSAVPAKFARFRREKYTRQEGHLVRSPQFISTPVFRCSPKDHMVWYLRARVNYPARKHLTSLRTVFQRVAERPPSVQQRNAAKQHASCKHAVAWQTFRPRTAARDLLWWSSQTEGSNFTMPDGAVHHMLRPAAAIRLLGW